MLTKKFWSFLVFFIIFVLSSSVTFAQDEPADALFINQVRGSECCASGSLENLQKQVQTFVNENIPAFFTLRYDALNDERYINYLREVIEKNPGVIKLGLFIEITPQLAKELNINYRGSEYNWFEGQNALTIGYTEEERRRIIDLVFHKFYGIFGYYPQLTTAWLMDTESLNYMHDHYSVMIHQITREQWGVDSYTLYGGPPHYPYPASRSWAFVPDFRIKSPLLIVRQTVNDPLLNYGDTTNTFTSQANDYLKDKNLEYFIGLLNQAVDQPAQRGFILLGLENSMGEKYQDEFIKQIQYVSKLRDGGKLRFPSTEDFARFWDSQEITVYGGKDLVNHTDNEAFWVTTAFYRVRLRVKEEKVLLTDLRLFNSDYSDPYNNYVAKKEAFWITPYLIDGSHWYKSPKDKRFFLQKLFSVPPTSGLSSEIQKDIETETPHIVFPPLLSKENIRIVKGDGGVIKMTYKSLSSRQIEIVFNRDKIIVNNVDNKQVFYEDYGLKGLPVKETKTDNGFKLEWLVNGKVAYFIENKCADSSCIISTSQNPNMLSEIRREQYPLVFPEPVDKEVGELNSGLNVHNPYAIANRNPVRIIVITRDVHNLPTILSYPLKISTNPAINKINNTQDLISKPIQYVDLYNASPQTFFVTVEISPKVRKQVRVFFAPDCKKEIKYCLFHPDQAGWYINSVIRDKIRLFVFGEQQ